MFHWLKKLLGLPVPLVVGPSAAPAWTVAQRGNSLVYCGYYVVLSPEGQVLLRVFGEVIARPGKPLDVLIYDPPAGIRNHEHGSCFQLLLPRSAWFKLHWHEPPMRSGEAQAYVEGILAECVEAGHV
jgi:hypothetical protein